MSPKGRLFFAVLVSALLVGVVFTEDSNPCRNIVLHDSWVGGNIMFDLSPLIDHLDWKFNITWDGMNFNSMTFAVCRGISKACPNTAPDTQSVCAQTGMASMCQEYVDTKGQRESFCPSSWNGQVEANLITDGDRGLSLIYHPGDMLEEFREPPNLQTIIYCDPEVTSLALEDVNILPPFVVVSQGSHLYIVAFRHAAGCPRFVPPPFNPNGAIGSKGVSPVIVGVISVCLLILGLAAGAFGGIWVNHKFGCFADPHRQAMAYTQFELDDDI